MRTKKLQTLKLQKTHKINIEARMGASKLFLLFLEMIINVNFSPS